MKASRVIPLLAFMVGIQLTHAQTTSSKKAPSFWNDSVKRYGFYMSYSLGMISGAAHSRDNSGNNSDFSGLGTCFDLQMGGSIIDNLFLHGNAAVKRITAPVLNGVKMTRNYYFDESTIGVGVTKYLRHNFFATANPGVAKMSFTENNVSVETNYGFTCQFKIGKEWRVSPRWLLGLACQYSFVSMTNRPGGSIEQQWNSNRFGITFNASMFKQRSK